jgi:hypothetical protein
VGKFFFSWAADSGISRVIHFNSLTEEGDAPQLVTEKAALFQIDKNAFLC